jgi:hypothetical protein
VAEALGRTETGVYLMARRMEVKFKPKPSGSLELGRVVRLRVPARDLEYYQGVVTRLGERFGLPSKTQVFLRALVLADRVLEDEENPDDTVRADPEDRPPRGV